MGKNELCRGLNIYILPGGMAGEAFPFYNTRLLVERLGRRKGQPAGKNYWREASERLKFRKVYELRNREMTAVNWDFLTGLAR